MSRSGVFLFLALCSASIEAAVEMKIVTTAGFVAFTVEDNWSVLTVQSRMPIATAAYQIPNAADNGTKDSTNLAAMLFEAVPTERERNLRRRLSNMGARRRRAKRSANGPSTARKGSRAIRCIQYLTPKERVWRMCRWSCVWRGRT